MTDLTKEAAEGLQETLKKSLRNLKRHLVEAAMQLDTFKKGKGWVALGYQSMTEWRLAEIQTAEFYILNDTVKLLEAGVPSETVGQMPLTNIQTLTHKLTKDAWTNPEWQKAAIETPVSTFARIAQEGLVEQHQEEMQRRGFVLPVSLAQLWDETIRMLEVMEGLSWMEDRIEFLISEYQNGPSKVEGLTRRQRYEQILEGENL